jgi:tetratricopeptide (TPR) repeat protein
VRAAARQHLGFGLLALLVVLAGPLAYRQVHQGAVLLRSGLQRLEQGAYAEAGRRLDTAVARGAELSSVLDSLLAGLTDTPSRVDAARAQGDAFAPLLRRQPQDARARYRQVEIALLLGQAEAALDHARALRERLPDSRAALLLEARALAAAGRLHQAIQAYKTYLGETP